MTDNTHPNYAALILETFRIASLHDEASFQRAVSEGAPLDTRMYWFDRAYRASELVKAIEAYAVAYDARPKEGA